MPKQTTLITCSTSLLICISSSAFSQDQQKPQSIAPVTKPAQVEITAKNETENARRDAAAKTVISNAELVRYGDSNITDAMKRVPGIIVIKGAIQLPGMSSNYTQILVDGEPPRGVSIADIPMSSIDRVEIYRLGSAEFSSQAMAGTINIILKKIAKTAQQKIKLGVSNAYAPFANFEWLGSGERDNLSYSLSLGGSENKGIFSEPDHSRTTHYGLAQEITRDYSKLSVTDVRDLSLRVNPVLQYKGSNGLSLRSTTFFRFYRGNGFTDLRSDFISGDSLPVAQSRGIYHSDAKGGNSSIKITDTVWKDVKLDLTLGASGESSTHHATSNQYDPKGQLTFKQTIYNHDRKTGINSTLKLTAPSNEEHDFVAGWNGSSDTSNTQRTQLDRYSSPKPDDYDGQKTHVLINKLAFFAQDEWKFKKASSAYFGLRWETVRVENEGNQQIAARNTSSVWSPIVQTLWQLNPENTDRLRLGLSRTYKAPANFFLLMPKYTRINSGIDNPNWRGNPSLKPELAWSLEGAYEHNGPDEWNYNLRLAVKKIEDVHRQNMSQVDGLWWNQFINAGTALSKRIDFDTQFPLKRFVSDAPNINFSFFISKNWSSISHLPKPDNLLTPIRLNINGSVDYTAKDLPLTLGASLRYLDGNPILVSLNKRQINRAKTDLDVYSLWKYSPKTQLRFAIDNLLKRASPTTVQLFETEATTILTNPNRGYRALKLNFEHSF